MDRRWYVDYEEIHLDGITRDSWTDEVLEEAFTDYSVIILEIYERVGEEDFVKRDIKEVKIELLKKKYGELFF